MCVLRRDSNNAFRSFFPSCALPCFPPPHVPRDAACGPACARAPRTPACRTHAAPHAPVCARGQLALREQLRAHTREGGGGEGGASEAALEAELQLRKESVKLREQLDAQRRAAAEAELELAAERERHRSEMASYALEHDGNLADLISEAQREREAAAKLKSLLRAAKSQLGEQREVIEAQQVQLSELMRRRSAAHQHAAALADGDTASAEAHAGGGEGTVPVNPGDGIGAGAELDGAEGGGHAG